MEESGPDWPKGARLKHSWLTTNLQHFDPHHPPIPPPQHLAQFGMCFPFSIGVSKQAGAIKGGCAEQDDEA